MCVCSQKQSTPNKKAATELTITACFTVDFGAPGTIRTCDRLVRSPSVPLSESENTNLNNGLESQSLPRPTQLPLIPVQNRRKSDTNLRHRKFAGFLGFHRTISLDPLIVEEVDPLESLVVTLAGINNDYPGCNHTSDPQQHLKNRGIDPVRWRLQQLAYFRRLSGIVVEEGSPFCPVPAPVTQGTLSHSGNYS